MTTLKLALWQSVPDLGDEGRFCDALDAALGGTDADVLITPELGWPGYGDAERTRAMATGQDGALIARVRNLAARHGRAIVLGYAEAADGTIYNSAICIDASGQVLQNYRKQMRANDYERACFEVGTEGPVIPLAGVPSAILICYDVEFPELVRRAARAGALLVIVPTALGPKWRVASDVVVPARAYENGIFVAYCNHAATPASHVFCGLSVVAGPDGRAVGRAGEMAEVLEVTIDLDQVAEIRQQLHFLRDLAAREGDQTRGGQPGL